MKMRNVLIVCDLSRGFSFCQHYSAVLITAAVLRGIFPCRGTPHGKEERAQRMDSLASDGRLCYFVPSMEEKPAVAPPVLVNWEAVRALAMVVGVRESARRMGISEEAVKKRCTREKWLESPEAQRANKMAIAQRSGLTVAVSPHLSPGQLISAEINQLGSKTRLSLARGIAKAGEHVESLDGPAILANAADVKSIAQTADLVHGWKGAAPQVKIRLDVLNGSTEAQPIDIEATEIDCVSGEATDEYDLDSY